MSLISLGRWFNSGSKENFRKTLGREVGKMWMKRLPITSPHVPSIAQLVERRTVVDLGWISLGRWFNSGSKEDFRKADG